MGKNSVQIFFICLLLFISCKKLPNFYDSSDISAMLQVTEIKRCRAVVSAILYTNSIENKSYYFAYVCDGQSWKSVPAILKDGNYTAALTDLIPKTSYQYYLYSDAGEMTEPGYFTTREYDIPILGPTIEIGRENKRLIISGSIIDYGGFGSFRYGFCYRDLTEKWSPEHEINADNMGKYGLDYNQFSDTLTYLTPGSVYEITSYVDYYNHNGRNVQRGDTLTVKIPEDWKW